MFTSVTSPVSREAWESVLKSDAEAVPSQALAWRDAILASGRYGDVSRLYEFESGRQVVLPLLRRRGLPRKASMTSWPRAWGSAGPICSDGQVSEPEASAVLADLTRLGALVTEVRLRQDADPAWFKAASGQFTVDEVPTWDLDLTGGFGEVWKHRFRSSFRQAVRKAERSAVEIEVDRSGRLLGEFWELYRKSMVRWAHKQHAPVWLTRRRLAGDTSPARLAAVAEKFGQDCATWLARVDGQPVAGIIVLKFGGYAKYYRGAMDKEGANKVRANEHLHRLAIEEACQEGYRWYDLGFARPGSPLAAFKGKFGADLRHTYALRSERLPLQAAAELPKSLVKKAIRFSDNT